MSEETKPQSDQKKNKKIIRILLFILATILGIAIIIYGGYDDSPGAQGIGLLIILVSFWKLIIKRKIWKRKTKE